MKIIPSEGLENLWRGQWTEIIINWRFLPICWFKEGCLLLLRRYLEVLKKNCGLIFVPTLIWINIIADKVEQHYIFQEIVSHFSMKISTRE